MWDCVPFISHSISFVRIFQNARTSDVWLAVWRLHWGRLPTSFARRSCRAQLPSSSGYRPNRDHLRRLGEMYRPTTPQR